MGGVTYRRTIAPNLSRKCGLRKEIENREPNEQEHEWEKVCAVFFGREKAVSGRGGREGPGGPHTVPGRGPKVARAWAWYGRPGVLPGLPQCHTASFLE